MHNGTIFSLPNKATLMMVEEIKSLPLSYSLVFLESRHPNPICTLEKYCFLSSPGSQGEYEMGSCSQVLPAGVVLSLLDWRRCCGAKASILLGIKFVKGTLLQLKKV